MERFCASLEKWQHMQNLVSRETVGALWERHILDSLQLLPLIEAHIAAQTPARIVDIGSGGGFPALPLAIALKNRPVHLHLIESRTRKCAFLKAIVRELGLPATVHAQRIEEVDIAEMGAVHVLTARALAGLPMLFGYLAHFWQPGTTAFLHKGREYGEEMREADSVWRTAVVKHQSIVDPQGVILEISSLERIA
nr:16S rRNA (guanine(527)-N(7))-methyltransferase RsmG [Pelagibacterium limicola]